MVIQVAFGFVLGVFILVAIVAIVWFLFVVLTKHKELTDEYTDVDDWFGKKNFADKLDRFRRRG